MFQLISQHKSRGRPIPESNVLQWFTQITLALKYVHDRHILHRDIKSQNVLLTGKEGRHCAKIADFGISKVLEGPNSLARTVVGTPYYLSPEMCQKQPYSYASDVWALGCVLYEMCALHVPFEANDMRQLVDRIVRTNAPRIPSSYSREFVDLCAEMLCRDQGRRPTAAALVQHPFLQKEIKRLLNGSPEGNGGHQNHQHDDRRKPLADQNNRGPSPSHARGDKHSRCASPANGAQHRHPSPQRDCTPRHRGNDENRHAQENRHQRPHSRGPSPHHRDFPHGVKPGRAPSPVPLAPRR